MALAVHKLQDWPFPGPVGLREYDAASGRTDIHVFDHWCHLATVQTEADLNEVLTSRQIKAFDVDIYGLLRKRLSAGGTVSAGWIRFAAREGIDLAQH